MLGLPWWCSIKNVPANAGDRGWNHGLRRFHVSRATKPMCHNYWAWALEPLNYNYLNYWETADAKQRSQKAAGSGWWVQIRTRQAPSGGLDTPWGLLESLPPPPAAPPPVALLAPEGVCSPGLECNSLGQGAEQVACWGERVSVLISLGTRRWGSPGDFVFQFQSVWRAFGALWASGGVRGLGSPSSSPGEVGSGHVSHIAGGFFTVWATREAQEYWSGQPIPSPGELPDPGIKRVSCTAGRFFTSWATREAQHIHYHL